MARNTKRTPIGRLAALIIVAGSAFLVGLGVAKMVNDEPIEKDGGAHVAKWDIEVDPTGGNSVNLSAGSDAQLYGLTVTNSSDVASNYTIKVSGIPSGVKIGLDIQTDADLQEPINGEVSFTNTGGILGFSGGNNSRSHALTLMALPGASVTSGDGADMKIELSFEQGDPRI